jgi:hypothetical protein
MSALLGPDSVMTHIIDMFMSQYVDKTHTTNSVIIAAIDENTAENVHVKHLL